MTDTGGWDLTRAYTENDGVRCLQRDDGSIYVVYENNPLNPSQMRALAEYLVQVATEMEQPKFKVGDRVGVVGVELLEGEQGEVVGVYTKENNPTSICVRLDDNEMGLGLLWFKENELWKVDEA